MLIPHTPEYHLSLSFSLSRLTQMTMQTALEGAVYSALSAARTRGDTDQVGSLENVRDWLDYDSTNATLTEMTAKADFLRNLGVPVNTD